jgi:hypothetical protein
MPSLSNASVLSGIQNLGLQTMPPVTGDEAEAHWPNPEQSKSIIGRNARHRRSSPMSVGRSSPLPSPGVKSTQKSLKSIHDMNVPDEILLMICNHLETEDLMVFAEAWERIGAAVTKYDIIRTRELQCFCFKKDYMSARLGVGVGITRSGRMGSISSEFDLLSHDGFYIHQIRRSVQGVPFEYWLPLPISNGHWRKVRGDVEESLKNISAAATLGSVPHVEVIYRFMNDVVVKLNQQASQVSTRQRHYPYEETAKSTLTHASEKAIESYFHLFHLLLCLATEHPEIIRDANRTLQAFSRGANSKGACPNLGHLLVAALISDVEMTDVMIKAIIKETITRNVVWMLDAKGAGMAELSYMEPSEVSEYRLKKTFEASKTSYRLLMFLNLFRRVAVGNPRKPLRQLRDEAFERHGAPPRGSAKGLANSIKRIHQVNNFPDFLVMMGIGKPSAAWFTNFLRECVTASMQKGYSRMPLNQKQALFLRKEKEPKVEVVQGLTPTPIRNQNLSFFGGGVGGGDGNRGPKRDHWRAR